MSPLESTRRQVSEPETTDEAVRAATGKGYDEWCDLIEAWDGDHDDHTAIASHLHRDLEVDAWWAQSITVGYERITGRRLPYQQADGTFSVSKSKTVAIDAEAFRSMLLSDERDDLFPGLTTELRSKPTSKALRIGLSEGAAVFDITEAGDGRTKVTVRHEKLPTAELVERWRFYWGEWCDAVAGLESVGDDGPESELSPA